MAVPTRSSSQANVRAWVAVVVGLLSVAAVPAAIAYAHYRDLELLDAAWAAVPAFVLGVVSLDVRPPSASANGADDRTHRRARRDARRTAARGVGHLPGACCGPLRGRLRIAQPPFGLTRLHWTARVRDRCQSQGSKTPPGPRLPGDRDGDEDPRQVLAGARGGAVRRPPGPGLHQGLPAHVRRLPRPGRAAVRRRVQLALRRSRGDAVDSRAAHGSGAQPQARPGLGGRGGARRHRGRDGARDRGVELGLPEAARGRHLLRMRRRRRRSTRRRRCRRARSRTSRCARCARTCS